MLYLFFKTFFIDKDVYCLDIVIKTQYIINEIIIHIVFLYVLYLF